MNYYSFVTLAKAAGANIRIKKNVVIDLELIEKYLENNCKGMEEKTDMVRGTSKDPGKQERLDNSKAQQLKGGKKKWVRYDEGAVLYSMGIHSFMDLANEAKAVYRVKRICLVNTEKLDEYIEVMYGDPDSN